MMFLVVIPIFVPILVLTTSLQFPHACLSGDRERLHDLKLSALKSRYQPELPHVQIDPV